MLARRTDEPHRVATVLELLFDLCFVVAVAQASDRLHHDLIENHVGHGLTNYLLVFFAIWWAWMNFTWFASAYETDDVPYWPGWLNGCGPPRRTRRTGGPRSGTRPGWRRCRSAGWPGWPYRTSFTCPAC
jgi:hypothetical protein